MATERPYCKTQRKPNATPTCNSHLAKQPRLDPDGDAVEGFQTPLDEVPLLDGDALAGTAVLADVAVPAAPLDDADAGDAEVGLHAQQRLVVPVGAPADLRRAGGVGRVGGLGPVQMDGKEGAGHDEAVGGIEVDLLGRWPRGRFEPVEGPTTTPTTGAARTRTVAGVPVVGHRLGGESDGLLAAPGATDLVLGVAPLQEVVLGAAGGAVSPEVAQGAAAVRIVPGVEGGHRRGSAEGPDSDVLQFGVVGRLTEDVGQLVQLILGQETEGQLVRFALPGCCRDTSLLLLLLLLLLGVIVVGGGHHGIPVGGTVRGLLPPMEHAGPVDGVPIPEELPGLGRRLGGRAGRREGQAHPSRTGRGQTSRRLLVGRRGGPAEAESSEGGRRGAACACAVGGAVGGPQRPPREGQADRSPGEVPRIARRRRVQRDHPGLRRSRRGTFAGTGSRSSSRRRRRRTIAILRHQVDRLAVAERFAPDAELDPGRAAAAAGCRGSCLGGVGEVIVHGCRMLRPSLSLTEDWFLRKTLCDMNSLICCSTQRNVSIQPPRQLLRTSTSI